MKNKKLLNAIQSAYNELADIGKDAFYQKMEEHRNGDIARIIIRTGYYNGINIRP